MAHPAWSTTSTTSSHWGSTILTNKARCMLAPFRALSATWKWIDRRVSDGVGVDGVGAKFPFFAVFCSFPRGRKLRDHRQQLPANVQKTLNSPQPKKNAKNKEKNNEEKRRKKKKKEEKRRKKRETSRPEKKQTKTKMKRNEKKLKNAKKKDKTNKS